MFKRVGSQRAADLSLLCLLADCATIVDTEKTLIDEAAEKIFPHLKLEESKRVALLILFLTGNCEQKSKPRKSDLLMAHEIVTWAKKNHAMWRGRMVDNADANRRRI